MSLFGQAARRDRLDRLRGRSPTPRQLRLVGPGAGSLVGDPADHEFTPNGRWLVTGGADFIEVRAWEPGVPGT